MGSVEGQQIYTQLLVSHVMSRRRHSRPTSLACQRQAHTGYMCVNDPHHGCREAFQSRTSVQSGSLALAQRCYLSR